MSAHSNLTLIKPPSLRDSARQAIADAMEKRRRQTEPKVIYSGAFCPFPKPERVIEPVQRRAMNGDLTCTAARLMRNAAARLAQAENRESIIERFLKWLANL